MRDPERITRILEKLTRLWMLSTDQRLGQLILNTIRNVRPEADSLLTWEMKDEQWEAAIDAQILRYKDEVVTLRGIDIHEVVRRTAEPELPTSDEVLVQVNEALRATVDGDTIRITDITIDGQDPGDEG